MKTERLLWDEPHYPPTLHRHLGDQAPAELMFLGNPEVLKGRLLALFCSVRCPGNLILQTYDLARELRESKIAVISGFHSPMEKECLRLLLRGTQPVVICPAQSIEQLRLPREWKTPIAEGRSLLLSPFTAKQSRTALDLARKRNDIVAALSEEIFVAHAEAGSKTETFCRTWLQTGKRIYLLADDRHKPLFADGAVAVRPAEIRTLLLR